MDQVIDFTLHIDVYLKEILNTYGVWANFIIFFIIFAETGFVIMPFLPGDSLIFALGAISPTAGINIFVAYAFLITAAILGDALNYYLGKKIGRKVFDSNKIPYINHENLEKTERFFEKHGKMTIILARFIPFIRTFAPFVAGIGKMRYLEFLSYNCIGAIAWVTLFLFTGYFFGNIPFIQDNFSLVIIAIIVVSIMPTVIHFIKDKIKAARSPKR